MVELISSIVILGLIFLSNFLKEIVPFEGVKLFLGCMNGFLWVLFLFSFLPGIISIGDWYRKRKMIQNGKVIGYKNLIWGDRTWQSPSFGSEWYHNSLMADALPTPDNTNGIYITKSRHDPELGIYAGSTLRILGEGQYIEHENGYRVYKATILGEV